MEQARSSWVIYLSLGCALLFMVLPLWNGVIRPDIATLTLFYWVPALPHRVGVTTAFLGIGQDLIGGSHSLFWA